MELIKVNLHSAVDVITNSSTTIFTYSEGSEKKAEELINELLKVLGSKIKAEDMFYMGVFLDDIDNYYEYDYEIDNPFTDDNNTDDNNTDIVEKTIKSVLIGEIERPEWMKVVDNSEEYNEYYSYPTKLYILPKEEKYVEAAKKITEFLYSTYSESSYG